MLNLHPEILVKDGKKLFAVQERLADAEDLFELRDAKKKHGKKHSRPLSEVKREHGLR